MMISTSRAARYVDPDAAADAHGDSEATLLGTDTFEEALDSRRRRSLRLELFEREWATVEKRARDSLEGMYARSLEQLVQFVRANCSASLCPSTASATSGQQQGTERTAMALDEHQVLRAIDPAGVALPTALIVGATRSLASAAASSSGSSSRSGTSAEGPSSSNPAAGSQLCRALERSLNPPALAPASKAVIKGKSRAIAFSSHSHSNGAGVRGGGSSEPPQRTSGGGGGNDSTTGDFVIARLAGSSSECRDARSAIASLVKQAKDAASPSVSSCSLWGTDTDSSGDSSSSSGEDEEEDMSEEEAPTTLRAKDQAFAPDEIMQLVGWWSRRQRSLQRQLRRSSASGGTNRRQRKSKNIKMDAARQGALLVVVEDIESVPAGVLDSVVRALHALANAHRRPALDPLSQHHRHRSQGHGQGKSGGVPVELVLTAATSVGALSNALTRSSANLLDVHAFPLHLSGGGAGDNSSFKVLMRAITLDMPPSATAGLVIGPRVFTHLSDTFRDVDGLAETTLAALKFLFLHHCRREPLAAVLALRRPAAAAEDDEDEEDEVDEELASELLSPTDEARLRKLLARDSGASRDVASDWSLSELVTRALAQRSDWTRRSERVKKALLVVEKLARLWGKTRAVDDPVGRWIDGGLVAIWGELCDLLSKASATRMQDILALLHRHADSLAAFDEVQPSFSLQIADASTQLTALRKQCQQQARMTGRSELQNLNVARFGQVPRVDEDFTTLVNGVCEVLRKAGRDVFGHDEGTPYGGGHTANKAWVIEDPELLKEQFHPTIKRDMQRELAGAARAAADRSSDDGSDDEEEGGEGQDSDMAIAYRLFTNSSRDINLGDWWLAFDQLAADEPEDDEGSRPKKRRKTNAAASTAPPRDDAELRRWLEDLSDASLGIAPLDAADDEENEEVEQEVADPRRRKQARFLRCVGDLAYMGFVQPLTRSRRAEHVAKALV